MTTDSSSSTNRFVLRRGFAFLIKYQNINFMYRHLFFSYYCTAVSFERVIHPNPLGFTLFFFLSLFLLFTSIIWRHWGWAVPFIFIRVVVATLFFGLEREAFRWRMSCDVCVCEGKLFSIKCRVIFNEMDKDPDDDDKKKQNRIFTYIFLLCLVITPFRNSLFFVVDNPIPCAFFFSYLWPETLKIITFICVNFSTLIGFPKKQKKM